MRKSKKQRILELIERSEIELFPHQIASQLNLNPSTVRVYLRELLKEGKIVQPYRGAYCSRITYGMIFVPLLVHCFVGTVDAGWLGFSGDVVEFVGGVKVRVQFGFQRRKITVRISCDRGMGKDVFLFALDKAFSIIRERTGREVDRITVKTFEVHRKDMVGVRIDRSFEKGTFCYTREGLFDVIERIYQKGDAVRHEYKFSKSMSRDELTALIREGVSGYNTQQGLYEVMRNVQQLTEAIKFQNRRLMVQSRDLEDVKGSMQMFSEAMKQHLALIKELRETTQALKEAVEKIKLEKQPERKKVPWEI